MGRERERERVYCEFSSFTQKWSLMSSGENGKKKIEKTKHNRERKEKKRQLCLEFLFASRFSFGQGGRTFGNGVV